MQQIFCEIQNGVAVLKMDDGKANAMTPFLLHELDKTLEQVQEEDTRLLIITGRQRFFSAGLDLKFLASLTTFELNDMITNFARTILRVYSFPIPTVAAMTGHAIAGGALLAFACDRRYATNGPFRIQINDVFVGNPLPSWMVMIAKEAIPPVWHTPTLLHAHAYTPKEALDCHILHGMVEEGEDVVIRARRASDDLLNLNLSAYAATKERMRLAQIERVLEQLKNELPGKKGLSKG